VAVDAQRAAQGEMPVDEGVDAVAPGGDIAADRPVDDGVGGVAVERRERGRPPGGWNRVRGHGIFLFGGLAQSGLGGCRCDPKDMRRPAPPSMAYARASAPVPRSHLV